MTTFIRDEGLLDPTEIDAIIAHAPADLVDFQRAAACVPLDQRPRMTSWLDRFHAGIDKLVA